MPASFPSLPLDVIDRLLMMLTDFQSLWAIIQTCTLAHGAFQNHPKSIVRAVAVNLIGPAFPQAAELLAEGDESVSLDKLLDAPSRSEVALLCENALSVEQLEDTYCMIRAPGKLNLDQSLSFRRAIYRYWRLCRVSVESDESDSDDDDDSDDDYDGAGDGDGDNEEERERQLVLALTNILQKLPDHELFALDHVFVFLKDISLYTEKLLDRFLFNGPFVPLPPPNVINARVRAENVSFYGRHMRSDLYEQAVKSVLDSRGISPEKKAAEAAKSILQDADPHQGTCRRCLTNEKLTFQGRDYFSLFGPLLASGPLRSWLKGLLARNYSESQAMIDYLAPSAVDAPRFDWSRFFDELCEIQVEDPEDAWDKDERYCVDCIYHLATERLYLWWFAKKRETGQTIKEDCWYGYCCRTQLHKQEHAAKLNHLCEPTRGDGYVRRGQKAGAGATTTTTGPGPAKS